MERIFSYTEVLMISAACLVLFDGIRRIVGTKIENGAICIKMTVLLIIAFLAQLSSDVILQYAPIRD